MLVAVGEVAEAMVGAVVVAPVVVAPVAVAAAVVVVEMTPVISVWAETWRQNSTQLKLALILEVDSQVMVGALGWQSSVAVQSELLSLH